ncbi:hypothetical protein [Streptomyces spirodelae]|uniref:Integral membrane protein n=1 Tax=Streptomyces spirodelae TaxID=2812904 RepID=A0ABS3WS30_9ACTN|nr:hypothetical protein [Streptomyces spirodelae]MBO8185925.1 hypothetical protein [Streptomyces spirodelae]
MATESTKTKQSGAEKSLADDPADEAVSEPADQLVTEPADPQDAAYDERDPDAPGTAPGRRGDWKGGAFAVVSAGLGLASLTGTSFSDMLRERKALIGQINGAQGGGSAADQVNAVYGAPWHTAAVVNGIFAVLALVVGGLVLATLSGRPWARGWVKAVALGGVVLGLLGLVVAGGMYFDLLAAQPEVPSSPGG